MALFTKGLPTRLKTSRISNEKGFTLAEVVVATLILAVLTAGVAGSFWSAQHFLNRARHRIQAYNFAIEALDKLRSNYLYSSDPAMVIAANHDETEIDSGKILKGEIAGFGGYLKFDVADTGYAADGYKQVIVKVHWNEPSL